MTPPIRRRGRARPRDPSAARAIGAALDHMTAAELTLALSLVGTHTLCDLLAGISQELRTRNDEES